MRETTGRPVVLIAILQRHAHRPGECLPSGYLRELIFPQSRLGEVPSRLGTGTTRPVEETVKLSALTAAAAAVAASLVIAACGSSTSSAPAATSTTSAAASSAPAAPSSTAASSAAAGSSFLGCMV